MRSLLGSGDIVAYQVLHNLVNVLVEVSCLLYVGQCEWTHLADDNVLRAKNDHFVTVDLFIALSWMISTT